MKTKTNSNASIYLTAFICLLMLIIASVDLNQMGDLAMANQAKAAESMFGSF